MGNSEKKSKEEKIVEVAIERLKLCKEAVEPQRKEAIDDLRFVKGDHWPSDVRNSRQQDNRPCLTINKLPQHVRQVVNDQKQNRPAIEVNPVDDYADVDTAEVLQGIIRNIENVSDAEYAYDKAFEGAARASFGFFRVATQYVDEKSFDQEARIETIDNPFRVYLDPYSTLPDGSDAKYGFVLDTMTKEEFTAEFGESKLSKHVDWDGLERSHKGWMGTDEVTIAEYFYKDFERAKLFELSDGETYFEDDLPEENEDGTYTFSQNVINPLTGQNVEVSEHYEVLNTRWSQKCVVKWIKMNAIEILEETEWPGSYIPIIPVYGDCLNIDGEVIRESVIRHSKDSQRILNYWASTEAEAITLAPKAPFIGAAGQFKGYEGKWAQANIKNFPFLEYNPVTHEGTLAPSPQRNAFEPPVMAITNARLQANEDIKATTGIYDPSLGNRSNETSGIAIQRRNAQAQTSNFHLIDNLSKSIRHCGRILVEIIPKIYDRERIVRALGIDGEQKLVRINSDENLMEDQKRAYHFSFGKYDVAVSTGPNYETKRQEARDSMLAMSQSNPKFADVAGDLMVRNMDWPGSKEIAERLKKTLPPNILEDNEDDIPPQAKAAIGQLTQQVEGLGQELSQAKELINKDTLKIQSNERIQAMKIKADLKLEVVKIEGNKSSMILQEEINLLNKRLESLGADEPVSEVIEDQSESGEQEMN